MNMLQTIVWVWMMVNTIKGHSDCGMYTANRASCFLCQPGYYKIRDCDEDGKPAACMPCPVGTFQTLCNQATTCQKCDSYCKLFNSDIRQNCTTTSNLVCECKTGYFLIDQGGGNGICKKHVQCTPGHGMSKPGNATADVQCEACVDGNTYSNISSSTQQCQKCSTCKTPVISACTRYQDTNCSTVTMPITDGWSQISPSAIIAVSVVVVAVAILIGVGLFVYIFCKQRRRKQKQINEAEQHTELKDVHCGNKESTPGPPMSNDEAVITAVFHIMAEEVVKDFNFLFRKLGYISGEMKKKEDPRAKDPPVDSWIEQSKEDNSYKGVKESHYELLRRWRQWYGELDNNFFLSIKQALEEFNANEILAQIKKETEFSKYINNNY